MRLSRPRSAPDTPCAEAPDGRFWRGRAIGAQPGGRIAKTTSAGIAALVLTFGLAACDSLRGDAPPPPAEDTTTAAPETSPAPDATPAPDADAAPEPAALSDLTPLSGEVIAPAAVRSTRPPVPAALTGPQASCLGDGGMFQRSGNGTYRCIRPTPDAGKSCSVSTDCTDVCLARSRSCTPFAPVPGCVEVLGKLGERSTLCRN